MATPDIIRGGRMLTLLVLVLVLAGWSMQDETLVERVSFAPTADGEGYVIRVHASSLVNAYSAPQLQQGNVVEFKVFNADLAAAFQKDDPQGLIEDVHVEKHDQHLVFRFTLATDVEIEAAAYRDRLSEDVLVSLRAPDFDMPGDPAIADGGEPSRAEPQPAELRPVGLTEGAASASASGERWRLDTIVIDAGHGGHDGGTAHNGVREKDVTLAVALQLGEYIERYLDGVEVVYTRKGDYFVELEERGSIANEAGGKLFISIHANAARNRSARGTETFILGPARTEEARRVMERENRIIRPDGRVEEYEAPSEQDMLMQTIAHSANMRNSEYLGDLIQRQFAERVHRTNRGVKQAGLVVLYSASMPAVLVELGFISNPAEARFLASRQGQAYMASAIFRAVREYKERYERGIAVSN